jgi:hypothetical protein
VRFLVAFAVALLLAGAARAADVQMVTLTPSEDLSLPFRCDWGYDWDERCYWDDSDRVRVGGTTDKVWRAALRFSLDVLPPRALVVTAELWLRYDRTCIGWQRQTRPCDGRGFELDAHPIYTERWQSEREVEFGPATTQAVLDADTPDGWLVFDVSDLAAEWWTGGLANDGVLLKLADEEEAFDGSGPAFPSSTYSDPALRPRLLVWYLS